MKNKLAIFPFLLALYPLIFLYSHNIDEVFSDILIYPVIISLGISVLLYLLFYFLTRNHVKSALITSVNIVAFYSFGFVQDNVFGSFIKIKYLFLAALIVSFIYFIWRIHKKIFVIYSEKTTSNGFALVYGVIGYYFLHIVASFFIESSFSYFKLMVLFTGAVILFVGTFCVNLYAGQVLKDFNKTLQPFIFISFLCVLLYVLIYQASFKGVSHKNLIAITGSFLIFLLPFIYYVKNIKLKNYTLLSVSVIIIFFIHLILFKYYENLHTNLIPELTIWIFVMWISFKIQDLKFVHKGVSIILNSALIILLLFPIYKIVAFEFFEHKIQIDVPLIVNDSLTDVPSKNNIPIYYIILDEYASSGTLVDIFNYNNTEFYDSLRTKGFYVGDWQTTSEHTHEVVASVLNMQEFNSKWKARDNFKAIQNNFVTSYLKKRSYYIIQYPVWRYESNVLIQQADTIIKVPKIGARIKLGDFYSKIILSSIFRRYLSNIHAFLRNAIDFVFNDIVNLNALYQDKPYFVFAHIVAPHAPFVVDKDGGDIGVQLDGNKYYLGQLQYVNSKVLNMVKSLQDAHDGKCAIIIQSDHGPRETETGINTDLKQKHEIFNAVYLPDGFTEPEKKYHTNINTFTFVFNNLFRDSLILKELNR